MLKVRNPFVYPGGLPGFNQAHPAAKGVRFSVVATPSGGVPTIIVAPGTTSKVFTIHGAASSKVTPFGPAMVNTSNINTDYLTIPAINETPLAVTYGMVVTSTGGGGSSSTVFNTNGTTGGSTTRFDMSSNQPQIVVNGQIVSSSNPLTPIGHTFFVAGSYNGLIANLFVIDLTASGKVFTSTSNSNAQTFQAPTSSQYSFMNASLFDTTYNLHAFLYSINNYLTLSQLCQWASTPWDFWYPTTVRQAILGAVSGTVAPLNYVDFAGNIGAVSLYGKALYGAALYSRGGAFTPAFAGDVDLVGQANFDGDLAPIVSFAGALTFQVNVGGDLAPSVTFGGNLTFDLVVGGALTPSVTFSADLTFFVDFVPLVGSFTPSIVLGASGFISGPLWVDTEPCPPSLWTPVDCGQATWQKVDLCHG